MPKVLCLGSFDVLHYGHIRFLNQCAQLGDVVVGLGTDSYQAGYKREPILTFEERAAALKELPQVSRIIRRGEVSIKQLCAELDPQYLVAGSDWIGQPFLELSGIDQAYLERNDITLVYVPRDHTMSTSAVIERVRERVSV